MALSSRHLVALDQDYVVDAAGLPTYTFAARPLSGLKCEVVLHHAETSFQLLIVQVSFVYWLTITE
jgi:hypothetical protein